jgi:mRNA-degrading endonuclease RelE of RelBE toxin-antitoxin system
MRGEEDVWRRRIGSYRVLYEVATSDRIVHVFRVVRRSSTTY